MQSEVESAAVEVIEERTGGVCHERVAEALARDITSRDQFAHESEEAIEAGVSAAIEEIDDETFDAAFDAIQRRVSDEIEGQAKKVALRMLRELAAKAKHQEVAAAD